MFAYNEFCFVDWIFQMKLNVEYVIELKKKNPKNKLAFESVARYSISDFEGQFYYSNVKYASFSSNTG